MISYHDFQVTFFHAFFLYRKSGYENWPFGWLCSRRCVIDGVVTSRTGCSSRTSTAMVSRRGRTSGGSGMALQGEWCTCVSTKRMNVKWCVCVRVCVRKNVRVTVQRVCVCVCVCVCVWFITRNSLCHNRAHLLNNYSCYFSLLNIQDTTQSLSAEWVSSFGSLGDEGSCRVRRGTYV